MPTTYNKRIALLISDQHLIPHGGVGQFAKGFCEMAERNGCVVDLILDKQPTQPFFSIEGLTISPKSPLPYRDHANCFAFKDSYNLEKAANFRMAMMLALQSNLYDMIVINTPEAMLGVYPLNLQDKLPVVFYTHNEQLVFQSDNFVGVFNPTFDAFFIAAMRAKGLVIGTQTDRNRAELKAAGCEAQTLPMPMPERGLLEPWTGDKEGVLFIGRWEVRKNPEAFVKVAKATGLPVKVLTSKKSAPKFVKAFEEAGIAHDVRAGIVGQEKVDFIRSARVFYMPSKRESYGFSLFEAAGHCHCVVHEGYSWTDNWDAGLFTATKPAMAADTIAALYASQTPVGRLQDVIATDAAAWAPWRSLMLSGAYTGSLSAQARCATLDDFYYSDFIASLGRFASSEDVASVAHGASHWQRIYTAKRTWLSKAGTPPADDELFSW